jgi:hypothetical protein
MRPSVQSSGWKKKTNNFLTLKKHKLLDSGNTILHNLSLAGLIKGNPGLIYFNEASGPQ